MSVLNAAVVQLNSQPNLGRNMKEVYRWLEQAAGEGAALVCLPENFAFMGHEKERLRQAETISRTVEENLAGWAKELGVYILGGGYPAPAENGKVFNRSVLVNPEGEFQASYHKIHLFDVELSNEEIYKESDMVQAGSETMVSTLPEFEMNIGLSVCYDIRFPELYRKQAGLGAHILTIPAAFTRPTGRDHWEVLLRARAIENQCYVVAPAQTGKHGETRETYGHAMIVDPWGQVLVDAGTEQGIVVAEVDMDLLTDIRRKLPALRHRVLQDFTD